MAGDKKIVEIPKKAPDERELFDGKHLLQVLRKSLPDVTGIRPEFDAESGKLLSIRVIRSHKVE